jgi:hypothetical protein
MRATFIGSSVTSPNSPCFRALVRADRITLKPAYHPIILSSAARIDSYPSLLPDDLADSYVVQK